MRVALAVGLMLVAFPVMAQQPSPAEVIDALNMKAAVLQQNLDQMYLTAAKQATVAAAAEASAKWVLDNWVKKD